MLASRVVSVLVPSCCALAISARLRIEKSSSVPLGRLWRSRSSAVICRWAFDVASAERALAMIVPCRYFLRPPWIFVMYVVDGMNTPSS